METIATLFEPGTDSTVAKRRPPDALALESGNRSYSWERFRRIAFKTGNLLRYHGVHEGSTVAALDVVAPETIFVGLATGLLGGRVCFDPDRIEDPQVIVGPTTALDEYDRPGTKTLIGFGEPPEDPSRVYFEREVWSENPIFPPVDPNGDRPFLVGSQTWSQREILSSATEIAKSIQPGARIAVRESLQIDGTVVGGIVAPLLAGGSILLPEDGDIGDIAVASGTVPESEWIDPRTIEYGNTSSRST